MELRPPKGFMAGPPWGVAGLLSPKPAKPEARLAGGVAALPAPPPDAAPAGHRRGNRVKLTELAWLPHQGCRTVAVHTMPCMLPVKWRKHLAKHPVRLAKSP